GAIAADARSEYARSAAFSLRLKHRVQDYLAATVQVAVRRQPLVWQGVLRADVFAPASFEDQANTDFVRTLLVKMQRGRARANIRTVIDAAERVDRILPQVTELGRLLHRQTSRVLKGNLVQTNRAIDVKQDAAGV